MIDTHQLKELKWK